MATMGSTSSGVGHDCIVSDTLNTYPTSNSNGTDRYIVAMIIDLGKLGSSDIHGVMTQVIIPRPIAWVLSDNGNGTWNFAPFSFFNGICSDPPLVMISVERRPCGAKKDTWVNIEERSDFVTHVADGAV